jgi:hypothetical protein
MREEPAAPSKRCLLSVQTTSVVFVLALLVLSGLSACGGGSSPAAPSPSASAQVGGLWTGNATRTGVTGGECLGPVIGSSSDRSPRIYVTIQQAGSSLTATVTNNLYAGVCTYSGAVGTTTISLTLQSCQGVKVNNMKCPNGDLRDMELVADAFTGTVDASGIGGTQEQRWNTFVSGTTTATGPLVINSAFGLKRGPFAD